MKALLLAAGKATRLGELSTFTPKCLHRVGKETLLDRIVCQLREVGVTDFLINTHHLADQIAAHIESRPDRKDFTIVHEPDLLGTLGTLKANTTFFGDGPGWVLHADNYIGGGLTRLRVGFEQRPTSCLGAVLTFLTDDPRQCGVMLTDKRGVLRSFFEKVSDPPSNQASAATFIFDSRLFSRLDDLSPVMTDISRDLLPHLVNRLVAVLHDSDVIDIGTRAGLDRARALANSL